MRCLKLLIALWAMSVGCAAGASEASSDICEQLRILEANPLSTGEDGKPVRRWVEFRWWGDWIVNGGWGCRQSGDQTAKSVCTYLMDNTSREFRAELPIRILTCYGYGFPQFPQYDWSDWTATVRLHGRKDDRKVVMDVDLGGRKSLTSTVRVSVVPNDPGKDDQEPPPLLPSDIPTKKSPN
jgi:hypothetical protein